MSEEGKKHIHSAAGSAQSLGPLAVGSDAGSDPGIHSTIPEHGVLSLCFYCFLVAPTFPTHHLPFLRWFSRLRLTGEGLLSKRTMGAGQRSAHRCDIKVTVSYI